MCLCVRFVLVFMPFCVFECVYVCVYVCACKHPRTRHSENTAATNNNKKNIPADIARTRASALSLQQQQRQRQQQHQQHQQHQQKPQQQQQQ